MTPEMWTVIGVVLVALIAVVALMYVSMHASMTELREAKKVLRDEMNRRFLETEVRWSERDKYWVGEWQEVRKRLHDLGDFVTQLQAKMFKTGIE